MHSLIQQGSVCDLNGLWQFLLKEIVMSLCGIRFLLLSLCVSNMLSYCALFLQWAHCSLSDWVACSDDDAMCLIMYSSRCSVMSLRCWCDYSITPTPSACVKYGDYFWEDLTLIETFVFACANSNKVFTCSSHMTSIKIRTIIRCHLYMWRSTS